MKHPLNVFIDTNIFQRKKFDVENETLKIFKRYIDIGIINYYTHKIILAECRGHISSGVKKLYLIYFYQRTRSLKKSAYPVRC